MANIYCTGEHRDFPAELLEPDSKLGQEAIGNMVPTNVGDWVYISKKEAFILQRAVGPG